MEALKKIHLESDGHRFKTISPIGPKLGMGHYLWISLPTQRLDQAFKKQSQIN